MQRLSTGPFLMLALTSLFCVSGVGPVRAENPLVENFPTLGGEYLGQDKPGLIPRIFAPFIAAAAHHKHSAPAFSPDGREVYFSVYLDYKHPQRIFFMTLDGGSWSEPKIAPFSGKYQEGGPFFSPDGQRLYFYSKRPLDHQGEQKDDMDIWFVERKATGWGQPQNLGSPINTAHNEYGCQVTADGTMYFVKGIAETKPDLYLSKLVNGKYTTPESLGKPINTPDSIEFDCQLTPDEKHLVFSSFGPPKGRGSGAFISARNEDGSWGPPKKMGDMINRGGARFVKFSPDGRYLFFASYRSGSEELYWVDARTVDYLKTEDLNLADLLANTVVGQGVEAALIEHDALLLKHAAYYPADERLLSDVSDRLIVRKKTAEAAAIIKTNFEWYPEAKSHEDRIKLALIDSDEASFDALVLELTQLAELDAALENRLNNLGYQFRAWDMGPEAIRVFHLNVQLFPRSPNVYDSYAEALMASGDRESARINYLKSLELNPENLNAVEMLKMLDGE
jgi:WD40-like Beta Propeller Repeat